MKYNRKLKNTIKIILRFILSSINLDVFSTTEISIAKEYYGSDYGGYVICPILINQQSIIYSFGIGDDISFDLEIIKKYGCNIFAYDPSPETQTFLNNQAWFPRPFQYSKIALSTYDGELQFYPSPNKRINYSSLKREVKRGNKIVVPCKKLETIMKENGHTHIDILKIDIEGAEYEVLRDIIKSNIKIAQLVIEFHYKFKEFSGNGIKVMESTLALLKENGFQIFDVSVGGIEYSFINKHNISQSDLQSCLIQD